MNRKRLLLCSILLITVVACSSTPSSRQERSDSIPEGARRIMEAYPQHVVGYENNHIIFWDGSRMIYNDGIKRTTEQMHQQQDVEEIFIYEYDITKFPPEYGYDPGRYRCAAFFEKIYGNTREKIISNLVVVNWCPKLGGRPILFTSVAGAAEALQRVSDELDQHPEFKEWVTDAQTFNWRPILGTTRLSPHCYGIAIDMAISKSHYWKWSYPHATESTQIEYMNTYNMEIVEIFERHGFIWGGRWYHFDTMHFEYRPEMNPIKRKEQEGVEQQGISVGNVDPAIAEELYLNLFDVKQRDSIRKEFKAKFKKSIAETNE